MKTVTVLLCLAAAAALAGLPAATTMPTTTLTPHRAVSAPRPTAPERPAAPWLGLEQLSPAERANARIHIEPGTPGAGDAVRRVEQLWNSGDFDAALAQFRSLGGSFDLSNAFVAINWRTPVPTTGTDVEPNVRIGNRDSAYCTAFDRNAVNGNLLVSLLRHAGTQTYLDTYLSTDNGLTWNETVNGYWSSPPGGLDGVCVDTSFFVAYEYPPENQVLCVRFDASNGQLIQFPSGTYTDTVFRPAPDTITEISMCGSEEQWPGMYVWALARTTRDSLLFSWAPGTGQPWTRSGTGIGRCRGMLDCAINTGYSTGGNWIWVSWIRYYRPNVLCPALAWIDDSTTTWHYSMETLQTVVSSYATTSVAAWHDTVFMAYTHDDGSRFYTQGIATYDGGAHYSLKSLPDTVTNHEMPGITGTHGEGFALVQRKYAGTGRPIVFTHAGYNATGWSAEDSASDHSADGAERPLIQWIAPGTYGVVYVTWGGTAYNSVWFNHTSQTGIAERKPAEPVPLGLRATSTGSGARLAFDNPAAGEISLRVFDAAGRLARSEDMALTAGHHALVFAGTAAGVYFVQLRAAGQTATAKFFITR